jgi:hypothetical protein
MADTQATPLSPEDEEHYWNGSYMDGHILEARMNARVG